MTTATSPGEPMIWLDGLDIPVVRFFDASFAEPYEGGQAAR